MTVYFHLRADKLGNGLVSETASRRPTRHADRVSEWRTPASPHRNVYNTVMKLTSYRPLSLSGPALRAEGFRVSAASPVAEPVSPAACGSCR